MHTIEHVERDAPDYLADESKRVGRADALVLAESEADIVEALRWAAGRDWPVTLQGARTGITAGATPQGGLVLNLSRMRQVLGLDDREPALGPALRVQPGLTLDAFRNDIARRAFDTAQWSEEARAAAGRFRSGPPFFFSPDPTETTASIGGMAANNASGAMTFRYGAMRAHVTALRMVLADGDVLALRRGVCRAAGRAFEIRTLGGRVLKGRLPTYTTPAIKSAAGYAAWDNMDLVDLLIGSEGTLGVFSEIEVRLLPAPKVAWGVMFFLPSVEDAPALVRDVRARNRGEGNGRVAAIEYFDAAALRFAASGDGDAPAMPEAAAALYIEWHGDDEGCVMAEIEDAAEKAGARGCDPDAAWMATDAREMDRLHALRHATPERINALIAERKRTYPELTKLGTDMAVGDDRLDDVLRMYRDDLEQAGLESALFGHIGNNHVHVNILPRDMDDYARGKALYMDWARRIVGWGGTVSAEHGIGKLKTEFLRAMYGEQGLAEMRACKAVFDPGGRLNRGNLFAHAG